MIYYTYTNIRGYSSLAVISYGQRFFPDVDCYDRYLRSFSKGSGSKLIKLNSKFGLAETQTFLSADQNAAGSTSGIYLFYGNE